MIEAFDWVTDTGGKAMLYFNFNGKLHSTVSTAVRGVGYPQGPTLTYGYPKEAVNYAGLYQNMRCALIKVKFLPHFTSSDTTGSTHAQNRPIYSVYDNEGLEWIPDTTAPNIDELIQNQSLRIKQTTRTNKWVFKAIKYPMIGKYPTIETGTPTNSSNYAGQWHGAGSAIGTMHNTNSAHVCLYTEGHNTGSTLGRFIVTYYCQYKDRQFIV